MERDVGNSQEVVTVGGRLEYLYRVVAQIRFVDTNGLAMLIQHFNDWIQ